MRDIEKLTIAKNILQIRLGYYYDIISDSQVILNELSALQMKHLEKELDMVNRLIEKEYDRLMDT